MSDRPIDRLSPEDYTAIEAAVLETSRGRWFLAEHARRNRHAETDRLIEWLQRIERSVGGAAAASPSAAIPDAALTVVAESIAAARREIAGSLAATADGGEPRTDTAFEDLAAAVERSSAQTLGAAEGVQEAVWSLREAGAAETVADDLERRAADIYRASSEQSVTATRVRTLIGVLHGIEARIHALLDGVPQAGADAGAAPAAQEPAAAPVTPEPPPPTAAAPARDIAPAPAEREEEGRALVPSPYAGMSAFGPGDDIVFIERPAAERRRSAEPANLPDLPPPDRGPERTDDAQRRPSPAAREEAPLSPRALPFLRLDALPPEERLALFA